MSAQITLAYHSPTDKVIHIDDVKEEDSDFLCLGCNQKLITKLGKIRDHHFSHINADCQHSQETALHKLAKQIIVENKRIRIPKGTYWNYEKATPEKPLQGIIPDVTALVNNEEVYFEVAVTNPKDHITKSFYQNNKLKCIEIHLDRSLSYATIDEIRFAVLKDLTNKKMIYPEAKKIASESPKVNDDSVVTWLFRAIAAFFVFVFVRWIFKRK